MSSSTILPVLRAPIATIAGPGADPSAASIGSDRTRVPVRRESALAIAGAMGASKLILLTDVEGVLDKNKKLVPRLATKDAKKMIADGTATGGMIPAGSFGLVGETGVGELVHELRSTA